MFAALGAVAGLSAQEPASNEAPAHMQVSQDSVSLSSHAQASLTSTPFLGTDQSSNSDSEASGDGDGDGDGEGDGLTEGNDGGDGSFSLSGGLSGFIAIDGDGGDGGGDGGDGDGD